MLMLAIYVGRLRGSMSAEREQELVQGLTFVPEQIHKMLENVDQIKVFAREYGSSEDAFFLGRSLDYAVALEGALKLKEISYIHAEAYAAGELKHGTLALIVSGVPVIVLATRWMYMIKPSATCRRLRRARLWLLPSALRATPLWKNMRTMLFTSRVRINIWHR